MIRQWNTNFNERGWYVGSHPQKHEWDSSGFGEDRKRKYKGRTEWLQEQTAGYRRRRKDHIDGMQESRRPKQIKRYVRKEEEMLEEVVAAMI